MTSHQEFLMAAAFILIGGLVFVLGFRSMRRRRLIRDTPRSKIRSMAMGLVEIHGQAALDEPLTAPISGTPCAYWKLEIEEYRRQSNSKGKGSTYQWVASGGGERHRPFFAEDDTGRVRVEPEGAEFLLAHDRLYYEHGHGVGGSILAIGRTVKAIQAMARGEAPDFGVDRERLNPVESGRGPSPRVGDRRYRETTLESGDTLFVLGTAARAGEEEVLLRRGSNEKTFLISDRDEKQVLGKLMKNMLAGFIGGGIFFVVGVVMLLMTLGIIERG